LNEEQTCDEALEDLVATSHEYLDGEDSIKGYTFHHAVKEAFVMLVYTCMKRIFSKPSLTQRRIRDWYIMADFIFKYLNIMTKCSKS